MSDRILINSANTSGKAPLSEMIMILSPSSNQKDVVSAATDGGALAAADARAGAGASTDSYRDLERAADDLQVAAALANIGVWSVDLADRTLSVCAVFRESYDLAEGEEVTLDLFRKVAHPDESESFESAIDACVESREPFEIELRQLIDGFERWVLILGAPVIEDGEVVRIRGCLQDRTDEAQTREDMSLLATRDYLTEVANRASFTNLFESKVKSVDFDSTALYLFIIDVDHFKHINDNFGHDVGDQVLREVSQILLGAVRGGDVVGRLGGDEFGLFVSGPKGAGVGGSVALRVQEMIHERESLQKIGGGVTLSIGFAEARGRQANFKTTLKAADLALYDAKRSGRNRAVRYREDLGDEYEKRERVVLDVTGALRRDEFEPFYQLKVSLKDGAVAGFEALARWRHPEKGVLTPKHWGEAFENQRLATRISETMLGQAARDAGKLRSLGLSFGHIAVNVTEKQIADPGFAKQLDQLCRDNGVACSDFEVEVTEAVLLARNIDGIRATMQELCDLGVTLALDDFGTGYASLTHLRAFPIHKIKIDQTFITDIEDNRDSRIIANAVVRMAHDLGLKTVAEGVETKGAADILRELGCDVAQGYYFGRPEPFEQAPIVCAELAAL